MVYNTSTFAIGIGTGTDSSFGQPSFAITAAGYPGIPTPAPNGALDISTNLTGTINANNNVSDGIVMWQPSDNVSNIQSYIDAHWSDRVTYAGGCCNQLNIDTDVGSVYIGN